MNIKTQFVSPVKRLAATIYDVFLLLGVWFGVGSIALWLNNSEILHPGIGRYCNSKCVAILFILLDERWEDAWYGCLEYRNILS